MWDSGIGLALYLGGFDEYLGGESDQQAEKDIPAFELETWRHIQAVACLVIERRLDPFILESVGVHHTVKELLRAIDEYCKPTINEVLEWNVELSRRLRWLSSSHYDDLHSYYKEFVRIRALYKRIGVELPESFYASLPVGSSRDRPMEGLPGLLDHGTDPQSQDRRER